MRCPCGAPSTLVRDRVPASMGARWRGHAAGGFEYLAACAGKVAEAHDAWARSGALGTLAEIFEAVLAFEAACLRLADQTGVAAAAVEREWQLDRCYQRRAERRRIRRRLRRIRGGLPMWTAIAGAEVDLLRDAWPVPADTLPGKLTLLLEIARVLRGECIATARAAGHTGEDLERARAATAREQGRFEHGFIWHGQCYGKQLPLAVLGPEPPHFPADTTQCVSDARSTRPTGRRCCP